MKINAKLGRKKLPESERKRFTLNCRLSNERNDKLKKVPGITKTDKVNYLIDGYWYKEELEKA